MSRFIDAEASVASLRSGGGIVAADSGTAAASSGLFARAMQIARSTLGSRADEMGLASGDLMKRFDSAVDKLNTGTFSKMPGQREDSIGAEGGGLLAGQLRHVFTEVLKEPHPVPNGMRLFKVNREIALGARSFEVRRFYEAGEARVHRSGDSGIPTVSYAQAAQDFQIRNYITSAVWDVFEEMSAQYASVDHARELTRIARDVLEAFANEMVWYGNDAYRIMGVLNYPWLDKEISDVNFYGTPADSRTILNALNGYFNRKYHASKMVLGPTKVATSPRGGDWLTQTLMGTTTTIAPDRSIWETFKASQAGRLNGELEKCWELQDVLGEGIDALLFYRDDERGIQNVIPGGGIQALPLHQTDIERRQIFWMSHGGVLMKEVGNNLLVFIRTIDPA